MQSYRETERKHDENSTIEVAFWTTIGDRENQQDSFGYSLFSNEGFFVVCDGMGGREGGKLASEVAVNRILHDYSVAYPIEDIRKFLEETACRASDEVNRLKKSDGTPLGAGTTMVEVMIRDGKLYWSSVGDSRGYLFRDGKLVQFTLDQTYATVLSGQLRKGVIDDMNYEKERSTRKAEALLCYLGTERLELIDSNEEPVSLEKGDRILIMSDGLYKLVTDEEMTRIIDNFGNVMDTIQVLEQRALRNAKKAGKQRDNMTVAIIRIK